MKSSSSGQNSNCVSARGKDVESQPVLGQGVAPLRDQSRISSLESLGYTQRLDVDIDQTTQTLHALCHAVQTLRNISCACTPYARTYSGG